jgi:hypothetical protein
MLTRVKERENCAVLMHTKEDLKFNIKNKLSITTL